MLLQFNIENYLSFKNEAILSLVGNKTTKELEPENIFRWNRVKILKTASIYGANASGKSNLFSGIGYMKKIVLDSFKEAITESSVLSKNRSFRFNPKTKNESSFFEVVILKDKIQYRYGFEINKGTIEAEWLYFVSKSKTEIPLFVREGKEIEVNDTDFNEGDGLISKTRDNVLFLSVCSQFNGQISNSILDWFKNLNLISGIEDRSFGNYTINKIKKDKKFRKWVNKFIDFLEISKLTVEEENIENINIDNIDFPEEKKELKDVLLAISKLQNKQRTKSILKSWHKVYDDNRILVDTASLDFFFESKGTQKLIHLLGPIYDTLVNGKVLFIDEFDARLHSILTRELVKIFHEGNQNSAQFIFVLQDPFILENDCLRRDQIYFVEKNQYGESNLYSLLDYKKVRNDEKFSKHYLKGNYGAIPYLPDFSKITEAIYGEEK